MIDEARRETDKRLDALIDRLTEVYTRAQDEVDQAAREFFQNFAALDEQKQKLVDKGVLTEKEYEDWRTNKILYSQRFKQFKQQYAEDLLHVNEMAAAYINDELPEIYAINYNRFANDAPYFRGMSFTLVDPNTVRLLALDDTSLLPLKKIDPAKDIPWNMRKVNSEVLQGILTGESIPKIAKRLQKVTEANKVSAVRAARTCVTGAENRGRYDKMHQMESMGIMVEKGWMTAGDNRVRPSHAALDGETQPTDVPFSNGLMYPGDADGAASEVYNCRCTTVTKVLGFTQRSGLDGNYI